MEHNRRLQDDLMAQFVFEYKEWEVLTIINYWIIGNVINYGPKDRGRCTVGVL